MISVFGCDIGEAEIASVVECMKSQWLGCGDRVSQFEREFARRKHLESFVMVDNGSNALFLAVKLLDLPPGSEVIIPSFNWVACAQAAVLAGHIPVFCDVDLRTMNVRRVDVEAVMTPRTAAVIVVHYGGLPVDIDPILELGLPVIEDAAHAVDAYSRGRPCGSIADIGIFSFDAVKNLTAGEGGGITAKSSELAERARTLRYCGIGKPGYSAAMENADERIRWWESQIHEPFIKMLPTDIAASIAKVQLSRLNELQARRRSLWEEYHSSLQGVGDLILPVEAPVDDQHGYFTYCLRTGYRDDLAHALLADKIYTTLRYHPLHMSEIYGQKHSHLPNCERLDSEALSIPLHPRMTSCDVEHVIASIRKFFEA
jgi:aminotransferase